MSKKQNEASIMSSLGGIFQTANKEKEIPPSPAPLVAAAISPNPAAAPVKSRGGKRSDTATYSQCTIYMKKETRRQARRALEDAGNGQDFSELVQELVEQWLKSRT
jgi:hypothetical protein